MKVLVAMKSAVELRSLAGIVDQLTDRGHGVHLTYTTVKSDESQAALEQFVAERPRVTFGRFPEVPRTPTSALTEDLRRVADYLHYLEPLYVEAPKLRERRIRRAPATARVLGAALKPLGAPGRRTARRALQRLERSLEPPGPVERVLDEQRPDVVLTTSLVSVGLPYAELVRAAKRRGIGTSYLVFSWDNLTNKGLIREVPDEVLVWNDLQAREAVELHGLPESRVTVTGAPSCDDWFTMKPSRSREEFARLVGLRPDRPIVLYVCSTRWIARSEVDFIRSWVEALRAQDGPTAEAGVVVRPHPRHLKPWRDVDLGLPNVVLWPPGGQEPIDRGSRQNYFDSIYHADAVVGINTSAQIEAAIVDRPVHTVVDDEFRETQEGTLHFQYLQDDAFGHLHVGRTMDEHVELLGASLRGQADSERNRRFVEKFVRPLGSDVAATPLVVESLERVAQRQETARRVPSPTTRLAMRYLAAFAWRRRRRTRRQHEAELKLKRRLESAGEIAAPR